MPRAMVKSAFLLGAALSTGGWAIAAWLTGPMPWPGLVAACAVYAVLAVFAAWSEEAARDA
jgi:hypothetical protein